MENQNQNPKDQLIERLKSSNNILVTVSRNPSVDQLSAAIGLTVMLNQMDKHATAVFSGEVPDTLEFLKPEETLEKNTDSLRDFIISLDKAKADKLRYKVEDTFVKIFITPYKTSLSEADLVFGQGDFNVDVVVALGVHEKEDLDQAIINHGRILHDAVVSTVNTVSDGQIGTINWVDPQASSLSEMLVAVTAALKPDALDSQIATAFLTGIVAETDRFSNEKTTSETMNVSANLMAAGANQQLVATKLEQAVAVPLDSQPEEQAAPDDAPQDGSLAIDHEDEPVEQADLPEIQPDHQEDQLPEEPETEEESEPSRLILDPPTLGGRLTANTEPEALDPSTDPMTVKDDNRPILTRDKKSHDHEEEPQEQEVTDSQPHEDVQEPVAETVQPEVPLFPTPPLVQADDADESVIPELAPPPTADEPETETAPNGPEIQEQPAEDAEQQPAETPIEDHQTLTDLEAAVDSPHIESDEPAEEPAAPDAEAALAAAHQAFEAAGAEEPASEPATSADGAMEVSHEESTPLKSAADTPPPELEIDPATGEIRYPSTIVKPSDELPADPTAANVTDPTAPPPVPPPMAMPPVMPMAEPPEDIDPNNLPPVNQ